MVSEVESRADQEESPQTQELKPGTVAGEPSPRPAETVRLAQEAALIVGAASPDRHVGVGQQERNWAAVAHASILVTVLVGLSTGGLGAVLGIAIPAAIWYVYRDKSEYVVDQARQATIFQVAGLVALLALATAGTIIVALGWVVTAVLSIVLIGLLLVPVMLVLTLVLVIGLLGLPIVQMVYGCYAAVEAFNGRPFRYGWIADLIDRYQAQT